MAELKYIDLETDTVFDVPEPTEAKSTYFGHCKTIDDIAALPNDYLIPDEVQQIQLNMLPSHIDDGIHQSSMHFNITSYVSHYELEIFPNDGIEIVKSSNPITKFGTQFDIITWFHANGDMPLNVFINYKSKREIDFRGIKCNLKIYKLKVNSKYENATDGNMEITIDKNYISNHISTVKYSHPLYNDWDSC